MTNFAWANPITGVREVAPTLEEARYLVYGELRDSGSIDTPPVTIFEQERAGVVSANYSTREIVEPWEHGYAFASPADGKRSCVGGWDITVEVIQILLNGMEEAPESVIVYRQRKVDEMYYGCPAPPAPPEEMMSAYRVPPPDTPESLIRQVSDGTCYDLQRAQILAMLWIAEALQGVPVLVRKSVNEDLGEFKGARHHWTEWLNLFLWILMVFLLIFFRH